MNKFVTCTIIALISSFGWAQSQPGEQRTSKTMTWKGTLVDSGCRSLQSERIDTSGVAGSYRIRRSKTSYGLITADGKCIPFDVNSNEKMSGILKMKTDWSENEARIKPRRAEVVGTEQDGKIAIDEIEIR